MSDRTALYRHIDAAGALLYVGISLQPFKRLDQHGGQSHWFRQIASVTVEYFDTRTEAMAAEKEAIKVERPRHNIIHADKEGAAFEKRKRRQGRALSIEEISENIMFCVQNVDVGRGIYFDDVVAGRSLSDFMRNFAVVDEYEGTNTDEDMVSDVLTLMELRGSLKRLGDKWFKPVLGRYRLVANDNTASPLDAVA